MAAYYIMRSRPETTAGGPHSSYLAGICKHCLRDTYYDSVGGLFVYLNPKGRTTIEWECDGRRWKRLGHKVRGF